MIARERSLPGGRASGPAGPDRSGQNEAGRSGRSAGPHARPGTVA